MKKSVNELRDNIKWSYTIIRDYKRCAKVSVWDLSVGRFIDKYISILVMFIPLKILLILSSYSDDETIVPVIGITISGLDFIILLVSITFILYILHFVIKYFSSKVYNIRINVMKKSEYIKFAGRDRVSKRLRSNYSRTINIASSYITIIGVLFIFIYLDFRYAITYSIILVLYCILIQAFILDGNSKVLIRTGFSASQISELTVGIFYLVSIVLLFWVVFTYEVHIHTAILMIILLRLSSATVKNLVLDINTLRYNLKPRPHK